MRKITYSSYMNDEFDFNSIRDYEKAQEYWSNDYELYTDKVGRVYTETGIYVIDIDLLK